MDPDALIRDVVAAGIATPEQVRAYNAWRALDGFCAEVQVWSERVFGVPVTAAVRRITQRSFQAELSYHGVIWHATLPWGRIVGADGRVFA